MAAITLTLSTEADVVSVRIDLTVPAARDRLDLSRVGPSGTLAYVRGYQAAVVSPGALIVRDFEAPLGVPLTYTVSAWAAATPAVTDTGSASITIPDGGCEDTWLTDLVRPNNTQKIVIEKLPELVYAVPVGVHAILGRRTPIVSGDIADTPSFELSFLTGDEEMRERARATLGNGVPVLLRTPPADGIGNLYFGVTDFREQRIVQHGREDDRRFVVGAVQVERPDPALYEPQPPSTYAQIEAAFATYAALAAQRASYDAVMFDYSIDEVGDVVGWPASDV